MVIGQVQADPDTGVPRVWQDKSGDYRASFDIKARDVRFLGGGGDAPAATDDYDDTIPF